jgi:hypothetical protein
MFYNSYLLHVLTLISHHEVTNTNQPSSKYESFKM